jgi:hypothetical protein
MPFSIVIKEMPDLRLIIIGGYPEEHKKYYLRTFDFIKKENLTEQRTLKNKDYFKNKLNILFKKTLIGYVQYSLSYISISSDRLFIFCVLNKIYIIIFL